MPTYRVFCLVDGKIDNRDTFEADDDIEAVRLFPLRGEKTDCELWCAARKVADIPRGKPPIWSVHPK